MKPFNNCYIIRNKTQDTTKIIYIINKKAFIQYLTERLDRNDDIEVTTGLCEEAPQIQYEN